MDPISCKLHQNYRSEGAGLQTLSPLSRCTHVETELQTQG